jgi:hypothetical protein
MLKHWLFLRTSPGVLRPLPEKHAQEFLRGERALPQIQPGRVEFAGVDVEVNTTESGSLLSEKTNPYDHLRELHV